MRRALLRPLTPEAQAALGGAAEVLVDRYPFRVGRESRYRRVAVRDERRGEGASTNDLYLCDSGKLRRISREHFQIEQPQAGRFILRERGSVSGTLVGDEFVGGDRELGEIALEDGNAVAVGGPDSPYVFRFVVLDEDAQGG